MQYVNRRAYGGHSTVMLRQLAEQVLSLAGGRHFGINRVPLSSGVFL
jgi:hypothetical protein